MFGIVFDILKPVVKIALFPFPVDKMADEFVTEMFGDVEDDDEPEEDD